MMENSPPALVGVVQGWGKLDLSIFPGVGDMGIASRVTYTSKFMERILTFQWKVMVHS